ncbi:MAG: hypothetical protein F4Z35_05555, partial [Dehalococcoidia bacterium]|nr:hypothetical protein [Dehalococcoidia bacterium]
MHVSIFRKIEHGPDETTFCPRCQPRQPLSVGSQGFCKVGGRMSRRRVRHIA